MLKIEKTSAEELKTIRKAFGLSQTKLAEILGVSYSSMSKFERGVIPLFPWPERLIFHMRVFYAYNRGKLGIKMMTEDALAKSNDAFISVILHFTTKL
jgi:transcriptional regulator with XRE-family HTH domain